MTTALYILAALAMFGIMITVHEAGHFFAARLLKIPVKEFAIGFGPKLLSWKSKKHETLFYLRAIPMGGYCAFYGEDDVNGKEKDDPRNLSRYSVWRRLVTVLMGPVMNILLAFVIAVLFYTISGVPRVTGPIRAQITAVDTGSPAQAAGLQAQDMIQSLNGVPISDNFTQAMDDSVQKNQLPLRLVVERQVDGQSQDVTLEVTPRYDQAQKRHLMGVKMMQVAPVQWVPGSVPQVIGEAYALCVNAGSMILNTLKNLLLRGEGAKDLTGVVGITKMIVEETRQNQLQGYLYLMSMISINLGMINLLPIPGLDGSRILFLLLEGVRRRPVKREGMVHAIGLGILFALMIWINLRDIIRLLR